MKIEEDKGTIVLASQMYCPLSASMKAAYLLLTFSNSFYI